jgi:UDP-N-acetylmuramoyl-tripeptide--D-alanyl-D-alanine ligase
VFPADEAYSPLWQQLAGQRPQLTFAMQGTADVTGTAVWEQSAWALTLHTPAGTTLAHLRIAGRHNLKNALAAATCALAAGAPLDAIARGLETFEPVKGRSQLKSFERNGKTVALVDDSYNANPDSVRAAIDVLAEMPGPQWLVLGEMGEVGTQGPQFHAEVGAYARERGIASLWTAGALCEHAAQAYGPSARHFATVPELIAALPQAPEANAVLVKGSRFMQMERVVKALGENA